MPRISVPLNSPHTPAEEAIIAQLKSTDWAPVMMFGNIVIEIQHGRANVIYRNECVKCNPII